MISTPGLMHQRFRSRVFWTLPIMGALLTGAVRGQEMPRTAGDTLTGKKVVLAEEVRGHAAVLVAGFSRAGGNGTAAWVKAIHADSALAGQQVYEIAEIAGAPGFVRGMIKSSMKKNVPAADQDTFVVFTQDEAPWRAYFEVSDDQVPYAVLIDAAEKVVWRGHGTAAEMEPQLREALRSATIR